MSEVKNYYEILGLNKDASEKDIKKAYRKLAAKWHPDKFANASESEKKEAEEKFKEINEANSVLSDPAKKKNYDQFGDPNGNPMMDGGFDPFDGFNPFGHNPFGGNGREVIERGEDDKIIINLTFDEAFNGCKKEFKFKRKVRCSHCNGTGSDDGKTHECEHCHGTGRLRTQTQRGMMTMFNETMCPYCHGTGKSSSCPKCKKCGGSGFEYREIRETITIPAGIDDGMAMTMQEYGHEPSKKGINGDLYVIFRVSDNQEFEKDGLNLKKHVKVNLYDAWCGCDMTVECADKSKIKFHVPELTPSGKAFRVQGKGWKDVNGYRTGDMYIIVDYDVPKKITNEQKELLKKFYNI